MLNSPYNRLKEGLVTKVVRQLRPLLFLKGMLILKGFSAEKNKRTLRTLFKREISVDLSSELLKKKKFKKALNTFFQRIDYRNGVGKIYGKHEEPIRT